MFTSERQQNSFITDGEKMIGNQKSTVNETIFEFSQSDGSNSVL